MRMAFLFQTWSEFEARVFMLLETVTSNPWGRSMLSIFLASSIAPDSY